MSKINLAYTGKINPEGVTPVLNVEQVWKGLQRKIRFAQEFVPVIESCEVLSDKDGVVKRIATFKKGAGPVDKATEVVYSYYPAWVDFEQEDGSHIRNVVSDGPSGELSDLNMTYMFEFPLKGIEKGSAEEAEKVKQYKGMAKVAVESSIDTIRRMVKDGRIE